MTDHILGVTKMIKTPPSELLKQAEHMLKERKRKLYKLIKSLKKANKAIEADLLLLKNKENK